MHLDTVLRQPLIRATFNLCLWQSNGELTGSSVVGCVVNSGGPSVVLGVQLTQNTKRSYSVTLNWKNSDLVSCLAKIGLARLPITQHTSIPSTIDHGMHSSKLWEIHRLVTSFHAEMHFSRRCHLSMEDSRRRWPRVGHQLPRDAPK